MATQNTQEVSFQLGSLKFPEITKKKRAKVNILNPGGDISGNVRIHIRSNDPKKLAKILLRVGYKPGQMVTVNNAVRLLTSKDDPRLVSNKIRTVKVENPDRARTNQRLSFLNTGTLCYTHVKTLGEIKEKTTPIDTTLIEPPLDIMKPVEINEPLEVSV